jgi:CubicO group peptidase (beta-lactamase class C family)
VRPRGAPAGILLKSGRIVAEWGDTRRADVTFSVAKSYLSMLAGIAVGDGLIASVDDRVGASVRTGHFDGPHNGLITWRHLLTQSSEWEGVLWEKSDQVDHFRQAGGAANNERKGQLRERQAPGTYYEYNDVRVNVLAFALLQRFGRALPDVLRERIMDPIGASHDWEWHGYSTSWTEVGGKRVQSVSGGSHWGGGLFIPTRDHARVGLLVANNGRWGSRQLLPEGWMAQSLEPSATNEGYGFLWWLNRGGRSHPSAPADSWFALGAGTNMIWVAPSHDLVAVIRWIDKSKADGFFKRLMAATA